MSDSLKTLIIRKSIHTTLCLLLLVALIAPKLYAGVLAQYGSSPHEVTTLIYSLVCFSCAFVNSFQVRAPLLTEELRRRIVEARRKIFEGLQVSLQRTPVPIKELSKLIRDVEMHIVKFETTVTSIISSIERDYEKKTGYIGATFGSLSVLISYILFNEYVMYGILSLAIVDALSPILTRVLNGYTIPHSKTSLPAMFITAFVFAVILVALGLEPTVSVIVASIAVVTEAYSPEDNLTLPLVVSAACYVLAPLF